MTEAFRLTPPYCRLTRVIRDIPSPDIMVGNKKTNFRQIVQEHMEQAQIEMQDIRSREIRAEKFDPATIEFSEVNYETSVSHEIFLQFTAQTLARERVRGEKIKPFGGETERKLLGFLRLSLPTEKNYISELVDAAMIREVHVYGKVSKIGQLENAEAQHVGLGTQLIEKARSIAMANNFKKLAVISAIGTKQYYRSRGFTDGELYQFLSC